MNLRVILKSIKVMKSKQIIKKVIVRAGDRRDGKDTEEIE